MEAIVQGATIRENWLFEKLMKKAIKTGMKFDSWHPFELAVCMMHTAMERRKDLNKLKPSELREAVWPGDSTMNFILTDNNFVIKDLQEKYKIMVDCVNKLEEECLKRNSSGERLSVRFFAMALECHLINPNHPHYPAIRKAIYTMLLGEIEDSGTQNSIERDEELREPAHRRREWIENYEEQYKLNTELINTHDRLGNINTRRRYDLVNDPREVIKIYDALKAMDDPRAEDYLVKSVLGLCEWRKACVTEDAIIEEENLAMLDSNLPSSSFSDANLCDIAEIRSTI